MSGLGSRVILTITANPALDVTYEVERLVPHTSHRVQRVREVAGGKGLNVSSVLAHHGIPALATGMVGAGAGTRLRADLDARGIAYDFGELAHETRRTVTVVDLEDGDATAFNEPGSSWTETDWEALLGHVGTLLDRESPAVVVASGSAPPGFPVDGYAQLATLGRAAGCKVVVDASGSPLLGCLSAEPHVVKPNRDELREVTGRDDPVEGAKVLQGKGAQHVVVSLGVGGMLVLAPDGSLTRAVPGTPLRGNPTGAGDAAVAAIAAGLADDAHWDTMLVDAVAWSAAAVLQPVAGAVDLADIARLRAGVRLEQTRS
jgi:tagatose 6-phosphate kinase